MYKLDVLIGVGRDEVQQNSETVDVVGTGVENGLVVRQDGQTQLLDEVLFEVLQLEPLLLDHFYHLPGEVGKGLLDSEVVHNEAAERIHVFVFVVSADAVHVLLQFTRLIYV